MGKKRKEFERDPRDGEESDGDFDEMEFAALQEFEDDVKKVQTVAAKAKGGFIYNKEGVLQKIEEIALPRDWPWIETLSVHGSDALEVDVHDDLRREAAFYQSSLAAVKVGLTQLRQSGVPFERPLDFYAESVKPDAHMSKIKQILLNDKKRLQDVEERKKQRELKKFAKAVHSDKLKERAQAKRDALDEIDRLKRKNKNNDASSATFKASIRAKNRNKKDGEGGDDDVRENRGGKPVRGGKPKFESNAARKRAQYGPGAGKRGGRPGVKKPFRK